MKALFNSAHRQSTAIRRDLDNFATSSTSTPALSGQLNASLTSFSRTIDEYNKLAKQELVPTKQEQANERVKSFRTELSDYRTQFDRLKQETDEHQSSVNRTELLGRRPHHTSTPENPYANSPQSSSSSSTLPSQQHANPLFRTTNPNFAPSHASRFGSGPGDYDRETHALREKTFMSSTNAQLDEFLERGRAVLGDLGDQREMLKGTQRKLYSVANTLGISGDTIRMIERRAKQDKWIFWVGVVVFFVFCYLVLRYLR
ncbi:transporter bos1 [Cryomyces antarcticus]